MKKIVQIKFGSHLYGTNTLLSDLDIKSLYLPSAQEILLQRVKDTVSETHQKQKGQKNTPESVDFEAYTPHKFLSLIADGQSVALEMVFAPQEAMLTEPDPLWKEIQQLALRISNKKSAYFIRYCRQQANKYGIKGSRISAAKKALDLLQKADFEYGPTEKLDSIEQEIRKLAESDEFLILGTNRRPDSSINSYFEICGKKALLKASIKSARVMTHKLIQEYGIRALEAEKNQGVDWKALSHAVRVGYQSIEFLSTHKITFPRPEAQHLLAIKQGKLTFKEVALEIEQLLLDVEAAAANSTLPETHDVETIDSFIAKLYRKIITEDISHV